MSNTLQNKARSLKNGETPLFHRKKTPPNEIRKTLALIARGSEFKNKIRGHKKVVVQNWIDQAYKDREKIEKLLKRNHNLKQNQLDHLWSLSKRT